MLFGENLTILMKENDISNVALGKELGVSHEAVRQWRTGKMIPSLDKAKAIADYFQVSLDSMLNSNINTERTVKLPLVGAVNAGAFTIESQEGAYADEYRTVQLENLYGRSPSECVLIEVAGDSMSPTFEIGDTLIIHRQSYAVNGNIVIAYDETENGYTIKEFQQRGDHITLIPTNKAYKPIHYNDPESQSLSIFGVVLGLLRKMV